MDILVTDELARGSLGVGTDSVSPDHSIGWSEDLNSEVSGVLTHWRDWAGVLVRVEVGGRYSARVEILEGPASGFSITMRSDRLRRLSPLELLALEAE